MDPIHLAAGGESSTGKRIVAGRVLDLGLAEYEPTWALQKQLAAERQEGGGIDTLILVEHPHVITLGRRPSSRDNVLTDEMPVVEVERGGDVTYHGPGQLVGYPILFLDDNERDLHAFLRALEEALIAVLGHVGIRGERRDKWTGVWVGARKVASLGVAVRRWVTLHGLALNVSTDLSRFGAIRPCGLDAGVMTSVSEILGRAVEIAELKPLVVAELGRVLGRDFAAFPVEKRE